MQLDTSICFLQQFLGVLSAFLNVEPGSTLVRNDTSPVVLCKMLKTLSILSLASFRGNHAL